MKPSMRIAAPPVRGAELPAVPGLVENPENGATQRRARYGHKDWILWRDSGGKLWAAPAGAAAVKAALLATGTRGRWTLYIASTGVGLVMRWRSGLNLLTQLSDRTIWHRG